MIESAGLYGESGMHLINLDDFNAKKSASLSHEYFGEGCTMITTSSGEKEILQLTWMERKMCFSLKKSLEFFFN